MVLTCRSALVVATLSLLTVLFHGCSPSKKLYPEEKIKVKIADLPISQDASFNLALEKGYFEDEGIEVERVKKSAHKDVIKALLSGEADFCAPSGASSITAIEGQRNPGKLKMYIVAGGEKGALVESILVRHASTISSMKDLKGKKLAIIPGAQWRTIATEILKKHNLKADEDVMLIEMNPNIQIKALVIGQIDALLGAEPIPTILKTKNLGKSIDPKVKEHFYSNAGAVRVDFAEKNPEATEKVLRVFARAVKEIEKKQETASYEPLDSLELTDSLTSEQIATMNAYCQNFFDNDVMKSPFETSNVTYSSKVVSE
jgi:ABC-type nitrate/sulfonate/bicarbonate transport system substrate-binding protein